MGEGRRQLKGRRRTRRRKTTASEGMDHLLLAHSWAWCLHFQPRYPTHPHTPFCFVLLLQPQIRKCHLHTDLASAPPLPLSLSLLAPRPGISHLDHCHPSTLLSAAHNSAIFSFLQLSSHHSSAQKPSEPGHCLQNPIQILCPGIQGSWQSAATFLPSLPSACQVLLAP